MRLSVVTLCRLMSSELPELPEIIDPRRLAEIGEELSGHYRVATMARMKAALGTDVGDAEIVFQVKFFTNKETRRLHITGRLESELPFICQRCMEVMCGRLDGDIDLIIADDKVASDAITGESEIYSATGAPVKLKDFIEDELLLLMSFAPLHKEALCPATERLQKLKAVPKNPFAALKKFTVVNQREI